VVSVVPGTEEKIQAAILLAFMVGAIQLVITLLRLGDLTRYISHSVIVGFTLGAATLLVLDQMKNLFGLEAAGDVHDHFVYRFWLTMTQDVPVHVPTLAVGIGTVAMVISLRWLKGRLGLRLLPDLLITVCTMAAIVAWLGLDAAGVQVIGEIPAKLPAPRMPAFDAELMRSFSSGALAIAVLGLLEAISMAKAIAAITGQKLDMNQQCLSEGLANFTGSFFQCIPGSGSLTRSAINQQAGASTQWSGVVSAAAVALIMLVFAPYARFIPRSALAGILMVSAWKMIDWHALAYHVRATRFDSVIVWVTAFSAVAISIEFCVLIGVFMSFLLTVPRAGRMLLTEFVVSPEGSVHERLPEDEVCGRILIFGLEGELFFGATAALEAHLDNIEDRVGADTSVVVLRMKRLHNADAVGLALIDGFVERMTARRVRVVLCGVRKGLFETMKRTGLVARVGEGDVFLEQPVRQTSTLLAIRHAYDLIPEPCPTCPRRDQAIRNRNLHYEI
jgi:sulfate permease, SulP family